jgi:hypothetical protein
VVAGHGRIRIALSPVALRRVALARATIAWRRLRQMRADVV